MYTRTFCFVPLDSVRVYVFKKKPFIRIQRLNTLLFIGSVYSDIVFCPSRQRSCICILKKTNFLYAYKRSVHLCVWKRTLAVYWDIVFCLNAAFIYVFGNERWLLIVFCLNAAFIYVFENERCLLGHCVLSQRNVHLCVWKRTLAVYWGVVFCLNETFIYVFGNERWLFIGALCFVSTQRSFMCLETNAVYWGVVFCLLGRCF